MKYYLVVNLSKENAAKCAAETVNKLLELGEEVIVDEEFAQSVADMSLVSLPHEKALEQCDIIISVGGDGTIIHSAIDARKVNKPIIGVNSGRMGFLTQIDYPLNNQIEALVKGDYTVQKHLVLEAEIITENDTVTAAAINDIIIARNSIGSMIDMVVRRHGSICSEYRADGLILATPTGSTAYSLSAGGAIVDPTVECIVMTPICPHSLQNRCVIINAEDTLEVILQNKNSKPNANVAVDGVVLTEINNIKSILVRRSARSVKFIQLNTNDFYNTLNQKFTAKN